MSEAVETATPADADKALFGSSLAKQMPDVDEAAFKTVNSEKTPETKIENKQQATGSSPALVDSQGRTFDTLIHETAADGSPVLKKDGKTIKCRRTPLKGYAGDRPARQKKETGSSIPDLTDEAEQQEATSEAEAAPDNGEMALAGAMTCAGLQIHFMRMALGEHVANEKTDSDALIQSWTAVFNHYGLGAVHPIVALGLITGGITFKALEKPEAMSRWRKMTNWVKVKLYEKWLWVWAKQKPVKKSDSEAGQKDGTQ